MFFSVTKLFQARDPHLRRLVYLVIKDVAPGSDEVIIITSSLMKDMNSATDLYRSNAIRVLCSITDTQARRGESWGAGRVGGVKHMSA